MAVAVLRVCVSAVAGGCLSASALAQSSVVRFEASSDGGSTWQSNVSVPAGTTVQVRMSAELSGATALGLAGFTCQPRVTNWAAGVDQLNPFTFPGLQNNGTASTETAYDGRAVRSLPASNTGRIFPFGSAGQGAVSASGTLVGHQSAGSLWFAGSRATNMGAQPQWGLSIAQLTQTESGTNFNSGLNVEVFRFAMVAGDISATRTVNLGSLSGDHVYWYLDSTGASSLIVSNLSVSAATITTVPGPGAVGVLGAVGLLVGRRRRVGASLPSH